MFRVVMAILNISLRLCKGQKLQNSGSSADCLVSAELSDFQFLYKPVRLIIKSLRWNSSIAVFPIFALKSFLMAAHTAPYHCTRPQTSDHFRRIVAHQPKLEEGL